MYEIAYNKFIAQTVLRIYGKHTCCTHMSPTKLINGFGCKQCGLKKIRQVSLSDPTSLPTKASDVAVFWMYGMLVAKYANPMSYLDVPLPVAFSNKRSLQPQFISFTNKCAYIMVNKVNRNNNTMIRRLKEELHEIGYKLLVFGYEIVDCVCAIYRMMNMKWKPEPCKTIKLPKFQTKK